MITDEMYVDSTYETEKISKLINPGSAYLRIMQYYAEEKMMNDKRQVETMDIWEKFISKYFSENVEMKIELFEKDKMFYEISKNSIYIIYTPYLSDSNYDYLPYIYLHKNKSLFNKWIFIDNYFETLETDEFNSLVKEIKMKDCLDVLEYKTNKLFIHFDAICKFDSDFKYRYVNVKISNIEIFDELNSKKLNIFELKTHLFSLYYCFKSFMEVSLSLKNYLLLI